jgi:hypothetical protein
MPGVDAIAAAPHGPKPRSKERSIAIVTMASARFRTSEIDLELRGSEAFVLRQLLLLAPGLGRVDPAALAEVGSPQPPAPPPPSAEAEAPSQPAASPTPVQAEAPPVAAHSNGAHEDRLLRFYRSFPSARREDQAEATLLFAYFLQREEGLPALRLNDLLRCCIRAGVDSRNFHRSLGLLTRRGLIEEVRRGETYRISEQGVATVEGMRA